MCCDFKLPVCVTTVQMFRQDARHVKAPFELLEINVMAKQEKLKKCDRHGKCHVCDYDARKQFCGTRVNSRCLFFLVPLRSTVPGVVRL